MKINLFSVKKIITINYKHILKIYYSTQGTSITKSLKIDKTRDSIELLKKIIKLCININVLKLLSISIHNNPFIN